MTEEQKAYYQECWRIYKDDHRAQVFLYRGDTLQTSSEGFPYGLVFELPEDRPNAPVLRISKAGHRLVVESESENEIVFRLEPK